MLQFVYETYILASLKESASRNFRDLCNNYAMVIYILYFCAQENILRDANVLHGKRGCAAARTFV